MLNNCRNCAYGIEHEKFIECSIKDEMKNSTIEWYDGCPYFTNKTQFFLRSLRENDSESIQK